MAERWLGETRTPENISQTTGNMGPPIIPISSGGTKVPPN